jgi:isopentenyl-diphosphate delta-isomerase
MNNTDRKKDHIELAFESQTEWNRIDKRFYYEPMLSAHPKDSNIGLTFLGKSLKAPIWISSMTGGTELAGKINKNLARAANEFGLGMGLGSCRMLLDSNNHLGDFDLRDIIGDELPFYANLGIAQIERLLKEKKFEAIKQLISKLRVDGLIIHVNPLQEWLQPEGDRISRPAVDTIKEFVEIADFNVIVKEVGQGFGPESIKALMSLPISAIDFAAYGGTNFSKIELFRNDKIAFDALGPVANIGVSASEMMDSVNEFAESGHNQCNEVIISGGIKSFLDGYYFLKKSKLSAVYGQASSFLKYAKDDYESLRKYIDFQVKGLALAESFLKLK